MYFLHVDGRGLFMKSDGCGDYHLVDVLDSAALLWQKEASDKSDFSCKRARYVHAHVISTDVNGIYHDVLSTCT